MVNELGGVVVFMFMVLVGIALVSVHYRKKYEELKEKLGIINSGEAKEEIRNARIELGKLHTKYSDELFKIASKIDKMLETFENGNR